MLGNLSNFLPVGVSIVTDLGAALKAAVQHFDKLLERAIFTNA